MLLRRLLSQLNSKEPTMTMAITTKLCCCIKRRDCVRNLAVFTLLRTIFIRVFFHFSRHLWFFHWVASIFPFFPGLDKSWRDLTKNLWKSAKFYEIFWVWFKIWNWVTSKILEGLDFKNFLSSVGFEPTKKPHLECGALDRSANLITRMNNQTWSMFEKNYSNGGSNPRPPS